MAVSGLVSSGRGKMWLESFEGMDHIKLLGCSQSKSELTGFQFVRIKLQETCTNDTVNTIVWFVSSNDVQQCTGGNMFASCDLDPVKNSVTLKTVLTDLKSGHPRYFECISTFIGQSTVDIAVNITVNYTETATTTTELPTSTTADAVKGESGAAGASTVTEAGFSVPNTVVFVILALLIFFIVTCCALAVIYFRGRRKKRRAGDCDGLSVRSGVTDKDFWFAGRALSTAGTIERPGGRVLRQYSVTTTTPPNTMAPEVPGSNRLVMQYQLPSDSVPDGNTFTFSADRGYRSGSSAHYQVPWGRTLDDQVPWGRTLDDQVPWGRTLDDPEIVSKLSTFRSPHRAMVRIPDFQPQPATPQQPSDQDTPTLTLPPPAPAASSGTRPTQESETFQSSQA